jgi:hypothetical protein
LLRDQRRGWDHLEVLLSLVCRLLRCLFGLLAMLVWSDLSKEPSCSCCATRNQAPRRQSSGHSLLAAVPVARLMEQMSIKISLKGFMGNPTVRAIDRYLDQ